MTQGNLHSYNDKINGNDKLPVTMMARTMRESMSCPSNLVYLIRSSTLQSKRWEEIQSRCWGENGVSYDGITVTENVGNSD